MWQNLRDEVEQMFIRLSGIWVAQRDTFIVLDPETNKERMRRVRGTVVNEPRCVVCGNRFTSSRADQEYCSKQCRDKAYKIRNHEEVLKRRKNYDKAYEARRPKGAGKKDKSGPAD